MLVYTAALNPQLRLGHSLSPDLDYTVSIQSVAGRVAERAREVIRHVCEARGVLIVRGGPSLDHIHVLVSEPPQLAPLKLVQYTKGHSSRRLQEEFGELRKRYRCQHLRARAESVPIVVEGLGRRCKQASYYAALDPVALAGLRMASSIHRSL